MQRKNQYIIPKDDAIQYIKNILTDMETTSPIPITTVIDTSSNRSFTGRINDEQNNNTSAIIYIGTHALEHDIKNDCINSQIFINTVISCFHEKRHIIQKQILYQQPEQTKTIRNMARTQIIADVYPEYKERGYYHLPYEADAEYYGITNAVKILEKDFPQLHARKQIPSLINSFQRWYGFKPVFSYSNALYNLQKTINAKPYDFRKVLYDNTLKSMSFMTNCFFDNASYMEKCKKAKNSWEVNDLLIQFAEEQNAIDKIRYPYYKRTINTTTCPSKLDRYSELNAKFGHLMTDDQSDTNFQYH